MCGIVYINKQKPVNNAVIKLFQNQRQRGTSGFGYFQPLKNRLVHNTRENRILKLLKVDLSNEILFHHRLPTSTPNVRNSCHPFSTKDRYGNTQYVMVHNGWIINDFELYWEHQDRGIRYISSYNQEGKVSFNDSEALLYDLTETIEGKQEKMKADGAIAFVAVKMVDGKRKEVIFGRNHDAPLRMKFENGDIVLSSEGDGELIEPHKLYIYDYKTVKSKDFNIGMVHPGTNQIAQYGPERTRQLVESIPERMNYSSSPAEDDAIRALVESEMDREEAIALLEFEEEIIDQEILLVLEQAHGGSMAVANSVDAMEYSYAWNRMDEIKAARRLLESGEFRLTDTEITNMVIARS